MVIEPVVEAGELLGFVKITRDITEQWQAQRLLRDAQRALRNTQQFETVGRLSRGLSHEFNNLLTTIGNALDLLSLRVSGDDARAAELLDAAQAATDRGALLTRQLLAFSTGQTLIREPLDINALVLQWLPDLQRACPPAVLLELRLTPGLPLVNTDAMQLQAALANLVANAADATLEGGRILIGTALEHRLDPDADSTLQRGYVTLSVCDDGHGMAADIAERATEPFFTTKDIGKGSGLGLSQVFGFTTQSGGFVDVSTTPGVGTTVSLLLPQWRTLPMTDDPIRVLMVEDQTDLREMIGLALRDLGIDVATTADAHEAAALLKGEARFDVVFSDVSMPNGMSGIELSEHVAREQPQARMILSSGYARSQLPPLPEQVEFLPKPYRLRQLVQLLKQA